MKSSAYPGYLHIISKTLARSTATGAVRYRARDPLCNHLRIRPFSDTPCRAATALEIDKILLSG
jgi:hypothetical protein